MTAPTLTWPAAADEARLGLVTLVPGLSELGMLFGLGSIVWFTWVGVVLLRTDPAT